MGIVRICRKMNKETTIDIFAYIYSTSWKLKQQLAHARSFATHALNVHI